MTSRMRVCLLYGGRSGEHEISLRSAASVARALSVRCDVVPVFIDHEGRWFLQDDAARTRDEAPRDTGTPAFLLPDPQDGGALRRLQDAQVAVRPDVFFPILHGTNGEDGTIQGLLELANVAYVGSGVAASSVGMDKALMKGVFAAAKLPQPDWVVLRAGDAARAAALVEPLGLPVFVKPANLGSSVGVTKVKRVEDLPRALDAAFAYDTKVIVERGIDAREIEVAVLGNESPEVSLAGEIVPDREFYDYDSKYSADSRTELKIPAPLEPAQMDEVRRLGARAFQAVDASGYARVDFLMDRRTGAFHLNEINTIPGFTSISMFPKLWGATGVPYADLVSRLVELGLERHRQRAGLRTRYGP